MQPGGWAGNGVTEMGAHRPLPALVMHANRSPLRKHRKIGENRLRHIEDCLSSYEPLSL